jgi:4-carboxymuconolactone decarboxylase
MSMDDHPPQLSPVRVALLPAQERDQRTTELLERLRWDDGRELNVFATLAHHPRLLRHWSDFAGTLMTGKLPSRARELLTLRTAWLCESRYEWTQHREMANSAGITEEEVLRVARGPEEEGWSTVDRVLLRAADELHSQFFISLETWDRLAEEHSTEEMIEICMLVGNYHMLAFTLNSLGVQTDPSS